MVNNFDVGKPSVNAQLILSPVSGELNIYKPNMEAIIQR